MDAHKKFINVAMRLPGQREFVEMKVNNEPKAVGRFARKLTKRAPGEVRCCYEAGPCGYTLMRQLHGRGPIECEVIAPALVPTKPGERVKTNRRDARKLCELYEAGLLTRVHPPSTEDEAVRDLSRCREKVKADLTRNRHRLSKWLLRHGMVYGAGRKAWTKAHRQWLRTLCFDNVIERMTFDEYLLGVEHLEERLARLDEQLEVVAQHERYREPIAYLRCFRGIDTVTAVGIVAELHDFRRFHSPRELMSYVGLTASEHSSGEKDKRGGITKAGNSHVRRLLVEASWHYRHRPSVGHRLRKRREGQPTSVICIADKAQQRLNRRYRRLTERGKNPNVALVAVARELVGFIWATLYPHAQREACATFV
jgi:transposase